MPDGYKDGASDTERVGKPMMIHDTTNSLLKVISDANPMPMSTAGATSVGTGTVTLTLAGTAQQLSASSVPCKRVFIEAHQDNAGTIVIGSSTVVGATSGRKGRALFPTFEKVFNVSNLNQLYLDGTVTGDKIHYYYEV